MNTDFQAFNSEWNIGDKAVAKQMALDYVAAHENEFLAYKDMTIPELVGLIDAYRAAGNEELRIKIDIWLLHAFEPQQIGGDMTLRRGT